MKSVFSSSVLAVLVAMAANPARAAIDPRALVVSDTEDDGTRTVTTSSTSNPEANWYPGMPGGPGTSIPGGPGTQVPDVGGTEETEAPVEAPSIPTRGPSGVNHITGPGGVIPTQNPAFTFDFPSLNTATPTGTSQLDPVVAAPTAAPTAIPTGTPTTRTPTGNRPPLSGEGSACPKDYVLLTLTDGNYTLDLPSPAPEVLTILTQGEDFVEFVVQNVTSVFGVADHVFTSFESGTFGEETCEMDEDLGTADDPASASGKMKAFCRVSDTGGKIALVKLYVRYPIVNKGAEIGKCCADPYKDTGYYTIALIYELKCRVCEQVAAAALQQV